MQLLYIVHILLKTALFYSTHYHQWFYFLKNWIMSVCWSTVLVLYSQWKCKNFWVQELKSK